MSDQPPSPDDLASRLLDDDLAGDELRRASTDPTVVEHTDRFRQVRTLLADVAPLPARSVDSMIATALVEYEPAAPPVVIRIDRHRRRRTLTWVAAAAAVVAVIAGVGALSTRGGDDTDDGGEVATPAGATPESDRSLAATEAGGTVSDELEAASGAATEAPAATEAAGSDGRAEGDPSAEVLSTITDATALAELARGALPLTGDTPCADLIDGVPVALATFQDTEVVVVRDAAGRTATAYDVTTCVQVLRTPIDTG